MSIKKLFLYDNSGNEYFYNDDSGMIFKSIEFNNNEKNGIYNSKYIDNFTNQLFQTINSNTIELDSFKLDEIYEKRGFNELILKLTDQCNMRCKYCIYSDFYPYTENYNDEMLKTDDAIKAVEIYMDYFLKIHNNVYSKKPVFAFYGGEPLLNFKTLYHVVEYIEKKYKKFEPVYTITTNGLLLDNEETTKFLMDNDFQICISIDSYKDNHDRNRIDINGNPTYDRIIHNINDNLSEYSNVYSLSCLDFKTDPILLKDFFDRNDKLNGGEFPHILRLSFISNDYSSYFDNFSKKDIDNYSVNYKQLHEQYINNCINGKEDWLLNLYIGSMHMQLYDRSKIIEDNTVYSSSSGSCYPGDKIYVLPSGDLSICEKVISEDNIIGNVETGINNKLVYDMIKKFNVFLQDTCLNCEISRVCGVCYSSLRLENGKYDIEESTCINKKNSIKSTLTDIINIEVENPGFYENRLINNIRSNFSSRHKNF